MDFLKSAESGGGVAHDDAALEPAVEAVETKGGVRVAAAAAAAAAAASSAAEARGTSLAEDILGEVEQEQAGRRGAPAAVDSGARDAGPQCMSYERVEAFGLRVSG